MSIPTIGYIDTNNNDNSNIISDDHHHIINNNNNNRNSSHRVEIIDDLLTLDSLSIENISQSNPHPHLPHLPHPPPPPQSTRVIDISSNGALTSQNETPNTSFIMEGSSFAFEEDDDSDLDDDLDDDDDSLEDIYKLSVRGGGGGGEDGRAGGAELDETDLQNIDQYFEFSTQDSDNMSIASSHNKRQQMDTLNLRASREGILNHHHHINIRGSIDHTSPSIQIVNNNSNNNNNNSSSNSNNSNNDGKQTTTTIMVEKKIDIISSPPPPSSTEDTSSSLKTISTSTATTTTTTTPTLTKTLSISDMESFYQQYLSNNKSNIQIFSNYQPEHQQQQSSSQPQHTQKSSEIIQQSTIPNTMTNDHPYQNHGQILWFNDSSHYNNNNSYHPNYEMELDLSENGLDEFPIIIEPNNYKIIDLSHNSIMEMNQDSLLAVKNRLEQLILFNNLISTLPLILSTLRQLTILDLSHNHLHSWPDDLTSGGGLGKLRELYLSGNSLTQFPKVPYSLRKLVLDNNQIESIEESRLARLTHLQTLDLSINKILSIPSNALSKLTALKVLTLSKNEISEIPSSLRYLTKLHSLSLDHNLISEIAEKTWVKLTRLAKLTLSHNRLKALSYSINYLSSLIELNISQNQIEQLPESICFLSSLKKLDVSNNNIKELPAEIGFLTKLVDLQLYNNHISNFPKSFLKCRSIREIGVDGNPLPSFYHLGVKAIRYHIKNPDCDEIDQSMLNRIDDLNSSHGIPTSTNPRRNFDGSINLFGGGGGGSYRSLYPLTNPLVSSSLASSTTSLTSSTASLSNSISTSSSSAFNSLYMSNSNVNYILNQSNSSSNNNNNNNNNNSNYISNSNSIGISGSSIGNGSGNVNISNYIMNNSTGNGEIIQLKSSHNSSNHSNSNSLNGSFNMEFMDLPISNSLANSTSNQTPLTMSSLQVPTTPPASTTSPTITKRSYEWEIDYKELEIRELIGQGGFSKVYHGYWKGKEVAIKQIELQSYKALEDFRKEVGMLSKLRPHENLLKYYGACTQGQYSFIVTEYLPRGSLYDILHREGTKGLVKIDNQLLLTFATGVALGCYHLSTYDPPIYHTDLKSKNLLVTNNLKIKICDFGLASCKHKDNKLDGSRLAYAFYAAPEILSSKPFTEKSDVFSFGTILWELVTNNIPFDGMDPHYVKDLLQSGKRLEIPNECPEIYKSIIQDCWKQQSDDRPTFLDIYYRLLNSNK